MDTRCVCAEPSFMLFSLSPILPFSLFIPRLSLCYIKETPYDITFKNV